MAKTLYIDCFSGVAGDMFLGAFLDLGLPFEALREALGSLAIDHGTITSERVLRAGVSATKFTLVEPAFEKEHAHSHDHDHGNGNGSPWSLTATWPWSLTAT